MCGIVGITGSGVVAPELIKYLKKLEYRGYDSSGVALSGKNGFERVRRVGKISELEKALKNNVFGSSCGIGHTRWATHGEVAERNAHPLFSPDSGVALVHNGIIENAEKIKKEILKDENSYVSETDTEVIAHLVSRFYKDDPVGAILSSLPLLEGSYALGIMFKDRPGYIYASSFRSPLVIAKGNGASYLASDVIALPDGTKEIYRLSKGEVAVLSKDGISFYDKNGMITDKTPSKVGESDKDCGKGGYEHYMLSEIMQQPDAVKATLDSLIKNGRVDLSSVVGEDFVSRRLNRIYIAACGSAYHTGLVAKHLFEKLCRVPCSVELASEFRYSSPMLDGGTLVIFVSQSGETADTLAALRLVKETDAKTLSIVNVSGSSLFNESESSILTKAGREIAVATTKAYSAQLAAFYAVALDIALKKGTLGPDKYNGYIEELRRLPESIRKTIDATEEQVKKIAFRIKDCPSVFYIGRLLDCAVASEGSLKLKEVSYINSQNYAAGELKHGTLSLIEKGTPVVAAVTQSEVAAKTASNISETKARGAYSVVITFEKFREVCSVADESVVIPETDELFSPSLSIIPMQLLGYYAALYLGRDIDKPKNLAKSVTVE